MDEESVSAFQVLSPRLDGVARRDMHHHRQLLEHRDHDMMRPHVVLPRRLPHGADACVPGRPPTP